MLGRRGRLVLATGAVVVAAAVPAQQRALRDLRELEHAYIASREPTACATQELIPFAFGRDADAEELDATLLELVESAGEQVRAQQVEFRTARAPFPLPPLRAAHRSLGHALDRQVALYDAMAEDPEGSEDELRALGRANTLTERRLASARRWLLVDPPAEWSRRFVCDQEPPRVPAP